MFSYRSKLIFPRLPFEDGGIEEVLSQLRKNLEAHGGDCGIEKDALYFAGNFAKFSHLDPLDIISGDVDIILENDKLICSCSISFLGPAIFLGSMLLLYVLARDSIFGLFLPVVGVGLLFFLLVGSFGFLNLIKVSYAEVQANLPC
jgi:hypothetical protein